MIGSLARHKQRPGRLMLAIFGLGLISATWHAPASAAEVTPVDVVDNGVVFLTFDDGPDQQLTPILLDLLDRHGVRATFFPVGRNLEPRWGSDQVQDLLNRGHAIGNHSTHHRHLTRDHPWKVAADLDVASNLLRSRTGFRPSCFRAPYGDRNAMVDEVAQSLGMAHVGWTADPQEWRNPPVPLVIDYLTRERHDGAIILLHDRKWMALQIVDQLIPAFKAGGWRFEIVSECRPADEREARMSTREPGEVPVGRIEAVAQTDSGIMIAGWAYDADKPAGGLVIRAVLDGENVIDLATTGSDHGFLVLVETAVELPLCLWAVDAGTRRHDSTLGCHNPGPIPDWEPPNLVG